MSQKELSLKDITFCTVNYHNDELLRSNIKNLAYINKTVNLIVTQNSIFNSGSLPDNVNLTLVPGIAKKNCIYDQRTCRPQHIGQFSVNIHHSLALEAAIEKVDTRYIVIFDADFFPIQPIHTLISYITSNKIAVIGAPYGASSLHKTLLEYRNPSIHDYPQVFFMLIDTNLFPKSSIVLDPRERSDSFVQKVNMPQQTQPFSRFINDTGTPLSEQLHRYKYESFQVCINKRCFICQKEFDFIDLEKISDPLERYFFKGRLFGIHIHSKTWNETFVNRKFKKNTQYIDEFLLKHDFTRNLYHPNSNYYDNNI
jgi:hypothetical protein